MNEVTEAINTCIFLSEVEKSFLISYIKRHKANGEIFVNSYIKMRMDEFLKLSSEGHHEV